MSEDLPEGWATAKVNWITTKVGSGATPRGGSESYKESGVPLIRSQNVHFDGFRDDGLVYLDDAQAHGLRDATVQVGDVLLNITGASIGRVTQVPERMQGARVNQHVCIIRPIGIDAAYLAGYLSSPWMQKIVMAEEYGVTRQALTKGQILDFDIPIAPLAEQQRIVAKVEELLSRVNAARQRLAKAPAILKRFRQSVLAAACSGRLTADWREKHESASVVAALASSAKGVDQKAIRHLVRRGSAGLPELELPDAPETWVVKTVRELVETGAILDFQDGNHGSLYPRESDFGETGVRFVTAQQVFDNRVEIDKAPFLKQEKADLLRIGFTIPGDVLLTHNATVGRVALLPEYNGPIILGTSVTYYRTNPSVLLPAFLGFQMQGNFWQDQLRSVMEQTTRNQVSVTKQVEFRLFVPPLPEQHEIVRRVEALFKLADAIEKRVAAATMRADKLTQAILAKAFCGEPVPTEAELARKEGREYEPASVLLERIKASTDCADSTDLKKKTKRRKTNFGT